MEFTDEIIEPTLDSLITEEQKNCNPHSKVYSTWTQGQRPPMYAWKCKKCKLKGSDNYRE